MSVLLRELRRYLVEGHFCAKSFTAKANLHPFLGAKTKNKVEMGDLKGGEGLQSRSQGKNRRTRRDKAVKLILFLYWLSNVAWRHLQFQSSRDSVRTKI